jgi:hypothetical protein
MKRQNCNRKDARNGRNHCKKNCRDNSRDNWRSVAIGAAALLAAMACGGCLYTVVPAMAGPSTTYPQAANSQPAAQPSPASQPSQPSNDQTNQSNQNKQQTGMPPNGAQPQGQGGTL